MRLLFADKSHDYLTDKGLKQLTQYKYTSGLSGFVDRVIMTPFWEFTVQLLPLWLAPNLITSISLLQAFIAHFLLHHYSPTLVEAAPGWVYLAIAILMFLYQTLDAIDGKQARRTQSSSPLGQLFDHGCDAITAFLMGIFMCATIQTGPTLGAYLMMHMFCVPFFMANWEESCTGFMRFGLIGVTEGQFLVMGVQIMTALYTPEFWQRELALGIKMVHVGLAGGAIGGVYQVVSSIYTVYHYYQRTRENYTTAVWQFIQFFSTFFLGLALASAPTHVFQAHARLILIIIGMLCSYQCSRLIISHTTGEYYNRFFRIQWPLPLLVLNSYSMYWTSDQRVYFNEHILLWAYFFYVLIGYFHFVYVTINQITSYLGISCFVIKPKHTHTK